MPWPADLLKGPQVLQVGRHTGEAGYMAVLGTIKNEALIHFHFTGNCTHSQFLRSYKLVPL